MTTKRKQKEAPIDPGTVLHRCPVCGWMAAYDTWPGAGAEVCTCDREPCECIPAGGCGTWCLKCGWQGYLTAATVQTTPAKRVPANQVED